MSRKILTYLLAFSCIFVIGRIGYYRYLDRNAIDTLPKAEFETDVEIIKGHKPKICTGLEYTESNNGWCPPHFAFFTAQDKSSSRYKGQAASIPFTGVCCPLPAEDILTDEHRYNVDGECPDSYVVTGTSGDLCGDKCLVRCSRINTERYILGKKYQSAYWKNPGTYPAAGSGGAKQIMLPNIPVGIAYAAGYTFGLAEIGEEPWDKDGCVGMPFGSLLVEKRTSGCGGLYFRPLLFRKTGGQVRTFAKCSRISGIAEKSPACVP